MITEPRTLSIKTAEGIIRQAGLREDELANHLGISSKTYGRRTMRGTVTPTGPEPTCTRRWWHSRTAARCNC
jgi:hypothetical protein